MELPGIMPSSLIDAKQIETDALKRDAMPPDHIEGIYSYSAVLTFHLRQYFL
jgi:hypothetical protein